VCLLPLATSMTFCLNISHTFIQNCFLAKATDIGVVLMLRSDIDWSICAHEILPNVSSYAHIMNHTILRPCFPSEHASLLSSMPIYVESWSPSFRRCNALCHSDKVGVSTYLGHCGLYCLQGAGFCFSGLQNPSLAAPVYRVAHLSSYFVIANNSPPTTR
jgi:hypothetical protein